MFAVRLERPGTSERKKLSVHVSRPEVSGTHRSSHVPQGAACTSVR